MKILFLNDLKKSTLQSDLLFHGLKSTVEEAVEYPRSNYMYGKFDVNNPFSLKTPAQIRNLFGIFDSDNADRSDLINKVKNNYFDYVFVSDPRTVNSVLTETIELIPSQRLIWIDGSDSVFPEYYIEKGIYFKKEIESGCNGTMSISLAIPEEKIKINPIFLKNKFLARSEILTDYDIEKRFYSEIQSSYFTEIDVSLGWNSMLLYETMANYSIPFYRQLDFVPAKIIDHLPKNLLEQVNQLVRQKGLTWVYTDPDLYLELQSKFFDYLRTHCTTQSLAKAVLDRIQHQQ